MTNTKTPKKGDTIWICGDYNGDAGMYGRTEPGMINGTVYIRELRVMAWGKKQAHFVDVLSGEKVGYRGYTSTFRFAWTKEGLNPQIIEITDEKLRRMHQTLKNQADWLNRYQNNPDSIRVGAVAKAEQNIAAVKASNVRFSLVEYSTQKEIEQIGLITRLK